MQVTYASVYVAYVLLSFAFRQRDPRDTRADSFVSVSLSPSTWRNAGFPLAAVLNRGFMEMKPFRVFPPRSSSSDPSDRKTNLWRDMSSRCCFLRFHAPRDPRASSHYAEIFFFKSFHGCARGVVEQYYSYRLISCGAAALARSFLNQFVFLFSFSFSLLPFHPRRVCFSSETPPGRFVLL